MTPRNPITCICPTCPAYIGERCETKEGKPARFHKRRGIQECVYVTRKDLTYCRKCGSMKRSDGVEAKPCRGKVRIGLRSGA